MNGIVEIVATFGMAPNRMKTSLRKGGRNANCTRLGPFWHFQKYRRLSKVSTKDSGKENKHDMRLLEYWSLNYGIQKVRTKTDRIHLF